MDHEKDVAVLRQIIRQLKELDHLVKTRLRQFLKGRSKEDMKDVLRDLDSASLELLCEMSLPDEDYEICQAVQEVLDEKKSSR